MNSSLCYQIIGIFVGFAMLTTALPAKEFFVYFGTYTEGLSKGIYVSRFDSANGWLSAPRLAATTPDPSYLTIAPDRVEGLPPSRFENLAPHKPWVTPEVTAAALVEGMRKEQFLISSQPDYENAIVELARNGLNPLLKFE